MERHSRRFDTMSKLCVQCRLKKRLFSQFRGQRIPSVSWQIWSERVALCGPRCNDATMPCSVRAVFAQFFTVFQVKDTGLDQGVRSLHLLWAEGSLGIPGYTWHIWLNGSDFRIESSGCLGTLCSPYDVAKSHDRLSCSTYLNLMEFADLVQRISEPRTSEPVTSGKLDI